MEAILDGVVTHNSESTNQRSCQLKFLTLLAVNFNVNFFLKICIIGINQPKEKVH